MTNSTQSTPIVTTPSRTPRQVPHTSRSTGGARRVARPIVRRTVRAPEHGSRLRIVPLGGLEEVGKNMAFFEYGNDIVVIDAGLMFPYEDMPGVDYVIPDTSYLADNRDRIRGIIITHGHLDHMGAIPYLIKQLGNPPIFGTRLTIGLIKERLEEFHLERYARFNVVEVDDVLTLGNFKASFFRVNHNIPDSVGIVLRTPLGVIVHTGDFKFDHTPVDQKPAEFNKLARIGADGVLLLMSDSTNAEEEGYAVSEKVIGETIDRLVGAARGRVIVSTFATLLSRIQEVINASIKHGRRVTFSGMSMEKTVTVAMELGYLKCPPSIFVKLPLAHTIPDSRLTILSTGSQGQDNSALGRMARGEHKQIQINKGDTVILSSSPIPGNERAVAKVMNGLFRLGADVIYNKLFDVHVSGHAYQEDLKLMLALLKPKYFLPVHGERYMLVHHARLAQAVGVAADNIFVLGNGQVLDVRREGITMSKERVPAGFIMVDGLGIGDVGSVVLRDRQLMAQDGMFVIITPIDNQTGKLASSPDILSRGFIYMRSSEKLLAEVRERVRQIVASAGQAERSGNWAPLRNRIRDDIGVFLFQRTERRPMILPVVIEV